MSRENEVKAALDSTKKEHEWLYQIRKRNKMRNPMWPRVHCEMFVLFLLAAFFGNAVIYRRRISVSYQLRTAIEDHVTKIRLESASEQTPPLVRVDTHESFYDWTEMLANVITYDGVLNVEADDFNASLIALSEIRFCSDPCA